MTLLHLAGSALISVMLLSIPANADPLGGTYLPEHEPLLQKVVRQWSWFCDEAQADFTDAGATPQSGHMRLEWPENIYLMEYAPAKLASVITMNAFTCDNIGLMGEYFGLTNGSDFYIIAEDKAFAGFGFNPRSVRSTFSDGTQETLVLIPHRGDYCRGPSVSSAALPCYDVAVWTEFGNTFNSVDGVLAEDEAIK